MLSEWVVIQPRARFSSWPSGRVLTRGGDITCTRSGNSGQWELSREVVTTTDTSGEPRNITLQCRCRARQLSQCIFLPFLGRIPEDNSHTRVGLGKWSCIENRANWMFVVCGLKTCFHISPPLRLEWCLTKVVCHSILVKIPTSIEAKWGNEETVVAVQAGWSFQTSSYFTFSRWKAVRFFLFFSFLCCCWIIVWQCVRMTRALPCFIALRWLWRSRGGTRCCCARRCLKTVRRSRSDLGGTRFDHFISNWPKTESRAPPLAVRTRNFFLGINKMSSTNKTNAV